MENFTIEKIFVFNEENIQNCLHKNKRLDVENKKPKCKQTFIQIEKLRNETVKLFVKVYQTSFTFVRVYLICLISGLSALSCYMVINSILTYLTFEVTTTQRTIFETPAIFPKITICNYNVFTSAYALDLLKEINANLSPNLTLFNKDQFDDLTLNQTKQLADLVNTKAMTLVLASNLSDENRKMMSLNFEDIFVECSFNFQPCTKNDFDWIFDKSFGNCYAFNANASMTSSFSGSLFGLQLLLYVNFHENLTLFNSYTGFRGAVIKVENNSYLIGKSMIENHIHLKSGTLTDVVITRSFKYYMEKPYSECDIPNNAPKSFDSEIYKLFAETKYQYSQQACFEQCYQQTLIRICNCTDSSVLSLFKNKSDCFDEKDLNCKKGIFPNEIVSADFIHVNCLPQCPLECNQTKYSVTTSANDLIGDYYAKVINEKRNLSAQFLADRVSREQAETSFVQTSMFYETLSYSLETESPKMNFVELLANLGGNLSLFMGLSVFSLCELIEIFIEIYLTKIREG